MTLIKYSPEEDVTYVVNRNTVGQFIRVKGFNLKTHSRDRCVGQWCCIHNPSDHPLSGAPLNWRGDRGIMERICEHGVGHNDPDDTAARKLLGLGDSDGVHGCDFCCDWGEDVH